MKNRDLFKSYIAELLKIGEWNPTLAQLDEIARRIAASNSNDIDVIGEIVKEVAPPDSYLSLEGVDNSDIRALLALALAAARQ